MNINELDRLQASALAGRQRWVWPHVASISARHVTYRSATAKMAAGEMLESSIAFWKEFNSGDLQVSTVARLVLNDSRKIAKELSLTYTGFCCSISELFLGVRRRFERCYRSLCIGR